MAREPKKNLKNVFKVEMRAREESPATQYYIQTVTPSSRSAAATATTAQHSRQWQWPPFVSFLLFFLQFSSSFVWPSLLLSFLIVCLIACVQKYTLDNDVDDDVVVVDDLQNERKKREKQKRWSSVATSSISIGGSGGHGTKKKMRGPSEMAEWQE